MPRAPSATGLRRRPWPTRRGARLAGALGGVTRGCVSVAACWCTLLSWKAAQMFMTPSVSAHAPTQTTKTTIDRPA